MSRAELSQHLAGCNASFFDLAFAAYAGDRTYISYKLMILCKDVHALLHVISLVDWPKHVKSQSGGCLERSGDRKLTAG